MKETEIKKIVRIAIEEIKETELDKIKDVDVLLNYFLMWEQLKEKYQKEIEEIKNGIKTVNKKSKSSIMPTTSKGGKQDYKGIPEIEQDRIDFLNKEINKLKSITTKIKLALEVIEDDPFYFIIVERYFNKKTLKDIAEKSNNSIKTIVNNKNRIIKTLTPLIFI